MSGDLSAAQQDALTQMQAAFKTLTREEIAVVKELQSEVDVADKAGTIKDAKLEFCYTVKFSKDRINNAKLLEACQAYITATEG